MHKIFEYVKEHKYSFAVISLLLVGSFLRLFRFNDVPYGMHQDEINAGYEAWSLLNFGTDRWGNSWPAYFLSWGSGQNVLYSYILIPFMAIFGDSDLIIRIPALLMGIVLPYLVYLLSKRWFNPQVALIALFISAFYPDFIRASRWAVESNIVPFMIALSLYVLTVALQSKTHRWYLIVGALFLWGLTAYSYVITLIPISLFLLTVLIWKRKFVLTYWKSWLLAASVYLVTVIPLVLFLAKTTIFKNKPFSFEQYLPFTIPSLEESRFDQITEDSTSPINVFLTNLLQFVTGNFQGQAGSGPDFVFPLLILGILGALFTLVPRTRKAFPVNLVSLYTLSGLLLVLFVPASNIRANHLFVPLIIMLSQMLYTVFKSEKMPYKKSLSLLLIVGYILYTSFWFVGYTLKTNDEYNKDFKQALTIATNEAASEKLIYLPKENWLQLDYMQVMWYERITPQQIAENPNPKKQLENFIFTKPSGQPGEVYYKVLTSQAAQFEFSKDCVGKQVLYVGDAWSAYQCLYPGSKEG